MINFKRKRDGDDGERREDDDELGVREERRRAHTENIHHTHSSLSKPMLLMHSLKEREERRDKTR